MKYFRVIQRTGERFIVQATGLLWGWNDVRFYDMQGIPSMHGGIPTRLAAFDDPNEAIACMHRCAERTYKKHEKKTLRVIATTAGTDYPGP